MPEINPQVDLEHATNIACRRVKAAATLGYFQMDFVVKTKASLTPVTVAVCAATARAIRPIPIKPSILPITLEPIRCLGRQRIYS